MRMRQKLTEPVPLLDKYIIIDTHGGSQDVVAIIAALNLAPIHHRKVIGITCATGIRNLENSVRDALIAQHFAGTQIPVFKGSNMSLMLRTEFPQCVNLGSTFPDLDKLDLPQKYSSLVQSKPAALFIEQSMLKYKQELCIITLGPMTNIALAFHLSLANSHFNDVSSVRINGGSYTGVGNVVGNPSAEGNLFFDPEAAHIVISNFKNVYINPIERTLETDLAKEISFIMKNDKSFQFNDLLAQILMKNYCTCGPLLTILSVFNKSISPEVINVYSEVILSGNGAEGLMVSNWLRLEVEEGDQIPNTKIFSGTDRQILGQLLKQALL